MRQGRHTILRSKLVCCPGCEAECFGEVCGVRHVSSAAGGDFTREILHKRENTGTQTLVSKPLETKRAAQSISPSFGALT